MATAAERPKTQMERKAALIVFICSNTSRVMEASGAQGEAPPTLRNDQGKDALGE
jgi:hypothetical protein